MDEEVLLMQCKEGNLKAFDMLIAKYEKRVYNIAYRMVGNHDDACDLAQEAFLRVFKAIREFKGQASFATWLYRITTNVCLDSIRKQRRYFINSLDAGYGEDGEYEWQVPDCSQLPETVMEQKELQAYLQEALNSLSADHRLVITLRDVQGFSYEEIAEITNCSLGTVKSRISRAREALKEKLKPYLAHYTNKTCLGSRKGGGK